jgi:hypothetical protein
MSARTVTLKIRNSDGRFYSAEYAASGKPKKADGTFYLRFAESGTRKRERLETSDPNEAAFLKRKKRHCWLRSSRGSSTGAKFIGAKHGGAR